MTDNPSYQPIFIMPEDTKRTTGKDAQRNNIAAARAVAQAVRTTLGPKGMDKMITDESGAVTITNDGVTILNEMRIEHPAAKMVVEVAQTQESVVGDGTTTAVVLSGELLHRAEELLDRNIHPTVLAKGYRLAEQRSQEILQTLAEVVDISHSDVLHKIAITAMTGKGAESHKDHLARLVVRAAQTIASHNPSQLNTQHISIEKKVGDHAGKSELIQGIVLDKERVHAAMPTSLENAKIALLDCPLEIRNTEIDAKIQITDPSQLNAFLDQEERALQQMVERIASAGVNVILCQRGIDDIAQHFLVKRGILAVRRIRKSDMETLSRATGGRIVSNWKDFESGDMGNARNIAQQKVGDEEMIFVTGCENPKSVTLLVCGSTQHVAEELQRAVSDALGDVAAVLRTKRAVGGAGSVEVELARSLRTYAATLKGREQLAVLAYADSLEIIPRTLAENAGLDPIDIVTALRSAHDENQKWAGINVFDGTVMDAWQSGVIEPLSVKTQALRSATEVAEMILRIDDVILGGRSSQRGQHHMPPL